MDAFSELEQLDANNPAPDSRPPKKKSDGEKPAPEKSPEQAKSKPQDKPGDKPADKAGKQPGQAKDDGKDAAGAADGTKKPEETDTGTGDDPTKRFQMASELRRDYRRIHAENERLASKVKELESGRPSEKPEERKALDAKLEALNKRNAELEEEISYRDYTKSKDFQEKYKQPFETKLARVYRQIADLYVQDGVEGQTRPATNADFDRVLEAGQADARRVAKEIFGDEDFREVLQYRRELNELQDSADQELKNWRDKAKEREENRSKQDRQMREQAETMFRKALDTYTDKYPDWFGDVEGDDELNNALHKGFNDVDRSQDRNLPLEQRLDLLAAVRLKAASFGRHLVTIKRLKAKVAELEESLKGYKASEPGEGQGQRSASVGAGSDGEEDVASEIDRIERGNPVPR